jgi:hypothetical protein
MHCSRQRSKRADKTLVCPAAMGPRGWLRLLFSEGRWLDTVWSLITGVGGILGGADLLIRLRHWVHGPLAQFELYLWLSLAVLSMNTVLWVVLYRTMRHYVNLVDRRTKLGRQAAEVQHRMAEAVRRCAHDATTYDLQKDALRVMAQLMQYLRLRLGHDGRFSITVKRIVPGKGRLQKVFRDPDQPTETRGHWDDIPIEESPVYVRFNVLTNTKRIVFIGDTNNVPATEDGFRGRAQHCGYRTVIAFPLRLPAPMRQDGDADGLRRSGELKVATLLGFFSIDAPDVGAFEELLKPAEKKKNGEGPTRDDDREPRDDLDVFYGIADSLATILVLTSAASETRARATKGGGDADDHEQELS